eukprot:gene1014-334_t
MVEKVPQLLTIILLVMQVDQAEIATTYQANTSYPPNQKEKLALSEAGLGRKKVTFTQDGDAPNVAKELEKIYPKLQGCGGFEILQSQGTKETLRLLIPPRSGYSIIFLRDLSGLGSALGYIRPIQMNLSMSKVPPQDPMCLGYLVEIPIDLLREHHQQCTSSNEDKDQNSQCDEDPEIQCENCLSAIKFSNYQIHTEECLSVDDAIMVDTPVDDLCCASTSAGSASKPNVGLTVANNAELKEDHVPKLIELTHFTEDECKILLNECCNESFDEAHAKFLKDGCLATIICIMEMKLKAATKFIKISHPEESLAAALAYFKGPDYAENKPISVNGCSGRLVPISSSMTLMSNILEIVGRIISHSIIEGGPAFPYLAPPVYWYLISQSVEKTMQHTTLMDTVSMGVKYVIDKIHGANTDEEFHQAILDTEVQIVLDESQWDRSTPIQLKNKLPLIQWLLQYDVLLKQEKAIQSFGKGLETLGILENMQKFPEAFEPLFTWSDEALSPAAVLELLEADADKLDSDSTFVWDILQEFIFECGEEELKNFLKFLTGSSALPSRGLPKRNVTVSFVGGDAFFVSTCLMELHFPKCFATREEFETSLRAAISCVSYNTW